MAVTIKNTDGSVEVTPRRLNGQHNGVTLLIRGRDDKQIQLVLNSVDTETLAAALKAAAR